MEKIEKLISDPITAKNLLLGYTCSMCLGSLKCMRSQGDDDTCENFKLDPLSSSKMMRSIRAASEMIRRNTTRGAIIVGPKTAEMLKNDKRFKS